MLFGHIVAQSRNYCRVETLLLAISFCVEISGGHFFCGTTVAQTKERINENVKVETALEDGD